MFLKITYNYVYVTMQVKTVNTLKHVYIIALWLVYRHFFLISFSNNLRAVEEKPVNIPKAKVI